MSLIAVTLLERAGKGWQCFLVGRWQALEVWGCLSEGNAAQTAPWHAAVRSTSQNQHRTLSQPILNTQTLSWSWMSYLAWSPASIHLIKYWNWSHNIAPMLDANHRLWPTVCRERSTAATHPPQQRIYLLTVRFWSLIPHLNLSGRELSGTQQ